ncbi:MAG: TPM domain-containing protein [Microscillaceae bacterium]|nr:TPM domain-containing protein [Microscillaceae bacterium]
MKITHFFLIMGVLHLAGPGRAQELPPRPEPARFVNDFANLLSTTEQETLETKLRNYQDSTSTQIAIVIIPSLNGQNIESYSFYLAQNWGIGQMGKDNGLLILMAVQDRKVRIEVGYGLEDRLPDLAAKHIIDSILIPNFRAQNYFQGFDEATTRIFDYLSGAYTVDETFSKDSNIFRIFMIIPGGLLIIIILSYLLSGHGASGKRKKPS